MYIIYNGVEYETKLDYLTAKRGFGEITNDDELIAYAEKATHGWYDAGWRRTFRTYYLSTYCLSEPYQSMTQKEFDRLCELQKLAREEYEKAEEARQWRYVRTIYWADNSEEEIWEDKDGIQKSVMTVGPHGDACY